MNSTEVDLSDFAEPKRDNSTRFKAERDEARRQNEKMAKRLEELQQRFDLVTAIDGLAANAEPWPRVPSKKGYRGIANTISSDQHFGEVVRAQEVQGSNAYDLRIAKMRLRAHAEKFVSLGLDHLGYLKYDGAHVWWNGDGFSGNIHEELAKSNEMDTLPTFDHMLDPVVAFFKTIADGYGHTHVSVRRGNHTRTSRKTPAKGRVRESFDWLFMRVIQRELRGDDRFTFDIPQSDDGIVAQYEHRFLATHGDQFKGGSGISGIMTPLALGNYRKMKRNLSIGDHMAYDTLVLGHFHQYLHLPGLIVNGCFPSGSKVMTGDGYTDIESVSEGDSVMSRDGTEQKVSHVFHKKADRLVGLKVAGLPEVVEATPNHLVWAAKRASRANDVTPSRRQHIVEERGPVQWIPIDFLSPGDLVHVPFPTGTARPVDVETAWAYGLYLAEGNTILDGGSSGKHNRVHLTMHAREVQTVERWAAWFEGRFGIAPHVGHRRGRNTTDLYVSAGREISMWFRDTFGHRAENKHLPDGALWWAHDLKAALLSGWVDGDGHSAPQPDCRTTVSATTISPVMAWQMFHIAPASGMWPSLARLRAGGRRKHDAYTIHLNTGQNVVLIDGEAFYPVAERFERTGNFEVYDLEVSGEHTYAVGGVGVHNSLKGYDEYAFTNNFNFEPPLQAFWVTTPEHGPSFHTGIAVMDRKKEGW